MSENQEAHAEEEQESSPHVEELSDEDLDCVAGGWSGDDGGGGG
ncbi:MAG: hypothetical protein AAGF23_01985 [Acidobacteriota bacterium]